MFHAGFNIHWNTANKISLSDQFLDHIYGPFQLFQDFRMSLESAGYQELQYIKSGLILLIHVEKC